MAEFVQLVVKVDKTQLSSLQDEVKALQGKTIKINVDAKGVDALKNGTNSIGKAAKQAAGEVEDALSKIPEGFTAVSKSVTRMGDEITRSTAKATDAMGKQLDVVATKSGVAIKETEKLTQTLTDEAKAANNAKMQSAMLADAQGKLIDKQEVWKDGSLIKGVMTYRDEIGNVTKRVVELEGSEAKVTTTMRENSEAMEKQANAAELAAKKNSLLGDSLDRIVAKIIAWQVINAGVASVIRAFRDAVQTIKEVDSALVTVQKTTDFSQSQIKSLTDETYNLASAYGRTADELMNLNADFARAGFKDNIAQMTELAALLENVGDLEGDVASKFLLAANAAWNLNGSYDALMGIIDGMNAVTNEAAVDMESLTTGITVAGSVFANAGESAQTFTALVGTGVAATQRSGAEIARGLRTIAMNIRQIKGELEDGEIIDEESISNAAKALNSVGVAVSENGNLRKISDVLDDLSEKWDKLTNAEQSYVAESLAGKRQANVLLAILQNYGEYERQLEIYSNGAGSALKENEIYLDSWEAKTKKLSAAWTEFISHFVNTDLVKGTITALTTVIEILDNDFVHFGSTVAAVTLALVGVSKAFETIKKSVVAIKALDIVSIFSGMFASAADFSAAMSLIGETILASPVAAVAAAVAGIYAITKAVDWLTVTYDEQIEVLEKLNKEYNEKFGAGSKYDELIKKEGILTAEEKAQLEILEAQKAALEETIRLKEKDAAISWLSEKSRGGEYAWASSGRPVATQASQNSSALGESLQAIQNDTASSITAKSSALAQLVNQYEDYYNGLEKAKDLEIELNAEETRFISLYETLIGLYSTINEEKAQNAAITEKETASAKKAAQTADDLKNQYNAVSSAIKDYQEYGNLTTESIGNLETAIPNVVDLLYDESGALTDAGKAALETATKLDGNAEAVRYLQREVDRFNVSQTLSQLGIENVEWDKNTAKIKENIAARIAAIGADMNALMAQGVSPGSNEFLSLAKQRENYIKASNQFDAYEAKWSGYTPKYASSKGGGSSKSSSKSEKDAELERLKEIVTIREKEYNFLKESDAELSEQLSKIKEIQSALHDEAEYIRSTAAYQAALTQSQKDASKLTAEQIALLGTVTDLSKEWWTWEKKRTDELKKQQEEREKAAKDAFSDYADAMKDALDRQRDAEIKPLEEQLDALEAQKKAVEAQREEQEKLLAVEQARAALENAMSQRTVRQYNAETDQWEWVANASTVKSAREKLENAEDALRKFRENQQYQERKDALNAEIEAIKNAYEAMKTAWEDAAKMVKDGVMGVADALSYAQSKMTAVINDATGQLSSAFNNLMSAMNGLSQTPVESASGTVSGVGSGASKHDWANDTTDYSAKMLNAKTADEFYHYAEYRNKKADAQGIDISGTGDGYRSNEQLYNEWKSSTYDEGGILRGVGGIKATAKDEMILPPDITRAILQPALTQNVANSLNTLGYLVGARNNALIPNFGGTKVGTQYTGDSYTVNVNGAKLQNITEGTTIGQIAQMAKNLSLYNRS